MSENEHLCSISGIFIEKSVYNNLIVNKLQVGSKIARKTDRKHPKQYALP